MKTRFTPAASLATLALALGTGTALANTGPSSLSSVGGVPYEIVRFHQATATSAPLYQGTLAHDYCGGVDLCGEPMGFASKAPSSAWQPWSLSVTGSDGVSGTMGIVMQDISSARGGLGVLSLNTRTFQVSGEDGLNAGETLTLAFNRPVTLVGLHFFDTYHTPTTAGDIGSLVIDQGRPSQQSFGALALSSYVSADPARWYTGQTFTFGFVSDDDAPEGYYLGAVKVMLSPVPEPASALMLLAGLAGVAWARRRHLATRD